MARYAPSPALAIAVALTIVLAVASFVPVRGAGQQTPVAAAPDSAVSSGRA